jgi:hypothetical protein
LRRPAAMKPAGGAKLFLRNDVFDKPARASVVFSRLSA